MVQLLPVPHNGKYPSDRALIVLSLKLKIYIMFVAYFLFVFLGLVLYGILGVAVMYLIDELDGFDELNIDVYDYPLAFVFFWPIMLIIILIFGIKQIINFIIDIFIIKKE